MEKIQKLSETTFSVPVPDQVIDVRQVQARKDRALLHIKMERAEIDECDALLAKAQKVGISLQKDNEKLNENIEIAGADRLQSETQK